MKNYWCYRIDKSRINYFWKELQEDRLRQGWGYDQRQDLRSLTFDGGARRNLPMFNKVKKGDILLVPYLPEWGKVAIVEAKEDWDQGYKFDIDLSQKSDWNQGDYGHVFPARFLKSFVRHNQKVSGNIRNTLRNPSRFWNITPFAEDIERILNAFEDLSVSQELEERLKSSVGEIFNEVFQEELFKNKIYSKLTNNFQSAEWEKLLLEGLRELFPDYIIDHTGGKSEEKHGTDILIRIPGIFDETEYLIAVQIKDWTGIVSGKVIEQINKADEYFAKDQNSTLIDKWVIITKAPKDANLNLTFNDSKVKFLFSNDLEDLLNRIALSMVHKNFLKNRK